MAQKNDAKNTATTITVHRDTRNELYQHKGPDDTYDDALRRVLERVSADG